MKQTNQALYKHRLILPPRPKGGSTTVCFKKGGYLQSTPKVRFLPVAQPKGWCSDPP